MKLLMRWKKLKADQILRNKTQNLEEVWDREINLGVVIILVLFRTVKSTRKWVMLKGEKRTKTGAVGHFNTKRKLRRSHKREENQCVEKDKNYRTRCSGRNMKNMYKIRERPGG